MASCTMNAKYEDIIVGQNKSVLGVFRKNEVKITTTESRENSSAILIDDVSWRITFYNFVTTTLQPPRFKKHHTR